MKLQLIVPKITAAEYFEAKRLMEAHPLASRLGAERLLKIRIVESEHEAIEEARLMMFYEHSRLKVNKIDAVIAEGNYFRVLIDAARV